MLLVWYRCLFLGFGVWLVGIWLEFGGLCLCGLDLFCFGFCGVRLLLGESLDACVVWLCFRFYCLMVRCFGCMWVLNFG